LHGNGSVTIDTGLSTIRHNQYEMIALALLAAQLPVTGMGAPELRPFEDEMAAFMSKHSIPGGSLAVSTGGRLVFAKGFGYLDLEIGEPVKPDSLFRLASVSKPITGLAIERLIEQGKLRYEDRVYELLGYLKVEAKDKRLFDITVRHLLNHSGGWDRDTSGDPMFKNQQIVRDLKVGFPVTQKDVIKWSLTQSLDFDPGTKFVYSNFGYCLLGRVVEKVTSNTYEGYVKEEILKAAGISAMHIGSHLRSRRAKNESVYYEPTTVTSIFDGATKISGAYALDPLLMDSHGGWVASAVDLMKLSRLLDYSAFFSEATRKRILSPPPAPLARDSNGAVNASFYTSGWNVRPVGASANLWHNGGMGGTTTLYVRLANGNSWAVLFNKRLDAAGRSDMDKMLHRAAGKVKTWPGVDYFSAFGVLK
jgi:N-acyl-D-amino-acid deacylase